MAPVRGDVGIGARRPGWCGRAAGVLLAAACVVAATPAATPVPGAAPEIAWEPPLEIATGAAERGPWRMNESRFLHVDDPTVAMDDAGGVAVAWADQAERNIYFQRFGPDGRPPLETPVDVSRSGAVFSWLPRLALAGEGGELVYLLWQEIVFSGGTHGGEIYFARSSDGGRSFSAPRNLSRTQAGAGKGRLSRHHWSNGSLDLALGPSGVVHAAWTEYEGPLRFSRSTDGGETFSAPLQVAGGEHLFPARGPSLAVGADGTIYLAWTIGEDTRAGIHLARSTDGGRSFGARQVVAAGPGHADAPQLAVSSAHLHLVYAESPDGPLRRYRIRHARARLGDDPPQFATPVTIAAGEGLASVAFPALAVDGHDHLYVLWERFPQSGGRPRGLGYAISGDDGASFSPAAVVPGSDDPALGVNGSLQGLLMRKLAVAPAGGLAVVNSSYADGVASRIRLYRGRLRRVQLLSR